MTVRQLTAQQALAVRMSSLLLSPAIVGPAQRDVAGIVEWFGAMQAQDVNSGLWSLGVRLPGVALTAVQDALERRAALRTWPMRGTVHLVPPADAAWMLELMASKPLRAAGRNRAALGLTDALVDKAIDTLVAALTGGRRLTRAQCLSVLTDAGLDVSGQRGYHLLAYASQAGHTCIAPQVGAEQSFALLAEWAPAANKPVSPLRTMAVRYYRSHGPATRQDFVGWTGLTMAALRNGLDAAGDELVPVQVDGVEMIAHRDVLAATDGLPADQIWVLPGFDEYLLGYKNRDLQLAAEHRQAIVPGGNGVFQPTVVRAGRVIATWRRSTTKTKTAVTVLPLVRVTRADRSRIEAAFDPYRQFLAHDVVVTW